MYPTTQQTRCAVGANAASGLCCPFVFPALQAPTAIPGGQIARAFPVLKADGRGPFTDYPPKHATDTDAADTLIHTYGTFREEPTVAFPPNTRRDDSWTLCIAVSVPKDSPTLLAVDYLIQYATTADSGNATVQTDVVLTAAELPEGVASASTALAIYRSSAGLPRIVDRDLALPLANTLAIKCNAGGEQWSHYVDTQHVASNVKVHDTAQLYVVFNVEERSTCRTARGLSVEVAATWQKKEVEEKAVEEEKRQLEEVAREKKQREVREEDEQKARDEHRDWVREYREARMEAKAAEKKAQGDTRDWRNAVRAHWEEEQEARAEAQDDTLGWRDAVRAHWKEEQEARVAVAATAKSPLPTIATAPAVADATVQAAIKEVMEKRDMTCGSGYKFSRVEDGYRCQGGSHFISFADLGIFA